MVHQGLSYGAFFKTIINLLYACLDGGLTGGEFARARHNWPGLPRGKDMPLPLSWLDFADGVFNVPVLHANLLPRRMRINVWGAGDELKHHVGPGRSAQNWTPPASPRLHHDPGPSLLEAVNKPRADSGEDLVGGIKHLLFQSRLCNYHSSLTLTA
jgi:hypothetical protein